MAGETDLKNALWLGQAFFEDKCRLAIPDLALYELGNALRFNPHFTAEDVTLAIHSLMEMNLTIHGVESDVSARAVALASQYDVTFYDHYFLARAVQAGSMLVTADDKFYQKVRAEESVVRLTEF